MSKHNSIDTTVSNQDKSKQLCKTHKLPILIKESNATKILMCEQCLLDFKKRYIQAFKTKASELYKNHYDYSLVDFVNRGDKISVICPLHGEFITTVPRHLNGRECRKCMTPSKGMKKGNFIDVCENNVGILYVLLCVGYDELFYKIGITSNTVKKRYSGKNSMPYKYEVLFEVKNEADAIYDLEKILQRSLYDYKYLPKVYFDGQTECFSTIDPIIDILNRL